MSSDSEYDENAASDHESEGEENGNEEIEDEATSNGQENGESSENTAATWEDLVSSSTLYEITL